MASQSQEDDKNKEFNLIHMLEVGISSNSMDHHQSGVAGECHKSRPKFSRKKPGEEGYAEEAIYISKFKTMESSQRINEDKMVVENAERARARNEEMRKRFNIK